MTGIQIGQLLPELAKQADKYSLIRSMTHGNNGHETASYLVQTGRSSERDVFPSLGAVTSYFKGYDHGYKGLIPPYIVLTEPQGRFSEAGFLGPGFKPFATGGDPAARRLSPWRESSRPASPSNASMSGGNSCAASTHWAARCPAMPRSRPWCRPRSRPMR